MRWFMVMVMMTISIVTFVIPVSMIMCVMMMFVSVMCPMSNSIGIMCVIVIMMAIGIMDCSSRNGGNLVVVALMRPGIRLMRHG